MNSPVREAIQGLQQALPTLQTTMLQHSLIGSPGVLRTIRASSSLENSQVAWGRFLNLPGKAGASDNGTTDPDASAGSGGTVSRRQVGSEASAARLPPADGKYYTHKELWGRYGSRWGVTREIKARWADVLAQWEVRRARAVYDGAEDARFGGVVVIE